MGSSAFSTPSTSAVVLMVMGVSGVGKSTVAQALATRFGGTYLDGDDLHPAANLAKLKAGIPLTDADRQPWLERLKAYIDHWLASVSPSSPPLVLACSALKRHYRRQLTPDPQVAPPQAVRWIYLDADPAVIRQRLAQRTHFMNPALLADQLATLEAPSADEALIINAAQPLAAILQELDRLPLLD